jgi:hypothetical protein
MNTGTIERYKHIRGVARKYLSSLVSNKNYRDVDPIMVGKLLGMYHRGKKMIFQSETEISVMMDFTLNERLHDGKSIIDRELERNHDLNQEQIEILKAYQSGYTSPFQVLGTKPSQSSIHLYDLIRDEDKDIVDVGLSRTVSTSHALFFRIVSFADFSMNSGASFVFNRRMQERLTRRYRAELRTDFVMDKSITRFLIFQRLNRELGEALDLIDLSD